MSIPQYTVDSEIDSFQADLSSNRNVHNNVKDIPEAAMVLSDTEEVIGYLENLVDSLESGRYDEAVKYEYQYQTKLLQDIESGSVVGTSILEQERTVAELEYLYDNDYLKSRETSAANLSLVQYLLFLFSSGIFPSLLVLVGAALLIAQLITYDKRKNTNRLVNILPTKMSTITISKYSVSSLFSLISILLPITLVSIFMLAKNGIGNTNYPVSRIVENSSIEIITASNFIIQNLVFIVLWVITITSISFLIYQFSGNLFLHTIVLLFFLLTSQLTVLENLLSEHFSILLGYLPSSYVDFQTVVTGGKNYVFLPSSNINFMNGIISLLLTSTFFILVTTIVSLRRKKHTNALF